MGKKESTGKENGSFTTQCCDGPAWERTDGPAYWQMARWAAMTHHSSVHTEWALVRLDEMVRWWKPLSSPWWQSRAIVCIWVISLHSLSWCSGVMGVMGIWRGSLVLHLLEELVGGVLIAVLLHLSEMTFLRGHRCIHLNNSMMNGSVLLLP